MPFRIYAWECVFHFVAVWFCLLGFTRLFPELYDSKVKKKENFCKELLILIKLQTVLFLLLLIFYYYFLIQKKHVFRGSFAIVCASLNYIFIYIIYLSALILIYISAANC